MAGLKLWFYSMVVLALGAWASGSAFTLAAVACALAVLIAFWWTIVRKRNLAPYSSVPPDRMPPPMQGGS